MSAAEVNIFPLIDHTADMNTTAAILWRGPTIKPY